MSKTDQNKKPGTSNNSTCTFDNHFWKQSKDSVHRECLPCDSTVMQLSGDPSSGCQGKVPGQSQWRHHRMFIAESEP